MVKTRLANYISPKTLHIFWILVRFLHFRSLQAENCKTGIADPGNKSFTRITYLIFSCAILGFSLHLCYLQITKTSHLLPNETADSIIHPLVRSVFKTFETICSWDVFCVFFSGVVKPRLGRSKNAYFAQ